MTVAEPRTAPARTMIVDTDIHPELSSIDQLHPYLDEGWRRRIELSMGGGANPMLMFQSRWLVPRTTLYRRDWQLGAGPRAGTDLDAMRRHLFDEEGIAIGILCGLLPLGEARVSYEAYGAFARAYNDWEIDCWLDQEPRLRGSVHVCPENADEAVREIERIADHPQIVQVFLPTVTDREYGDPRYHPIFEAAIRNELVVAFHHCASTETGIGWPRYLTHWKTLAAPQAAQNQLASLIVNGVFDKYPDLMTVFLETGVAWLPWFMWRIDENYREFRAEIPWVKRLPSEHIRSNVRFSTQPLGEINGKQFTELMEMADADRLYLFATDYPHHDADSPDSALPTSLPQPLRDRVLYQNALETYPRLRGVWP